MAKAPLITLLYLVFLTLLITPKVDAQNIDLELIEAEIPTTTSPSSTPTIKPKSPHVASPLHTGKINIKLNTDLVDFGILTPTNPSIRYTKIGIKTDSSYQILAYQTSLLKLTTEDSFIPNTSCDNGQCSETRVSLWTNTLTYGLGIQCSIQKPENSSCTLKATKNEYSVLPQEIEKSTLTNISGDSQLTLTYKLNVSPTQKAGFYENTLRFILIPTL